MTTHRVMPEEINGDPVVAVAPIAAYSDDQLVLVETWDRARARIVWVVGTVTPAQDSPVTMLDHPYDDLADALRAFSVALLEAAK